MHVCVIIIIMYEYHAWHIVSNQSVHWWTTRASLRITVSCRTRAVTYLDLRLLERVAWCF